MRAQAAPRSRRSTRRTNDRGVALIEMALALPILLAVIFVGMDLSIGFLAVNQLSQASREASRRVTAGETIAVATTAVQAEMAAHGLESPRVWIESLASPPGSPRLNMVRATARCRARWFFPALPALSGIPGDSLSSRRTMMMP